MTEDCLNFSELAYEAQELGYFDLPESAISSTTEVPPDAVLNSLFPELSDTSTCATPGYGHSPSSGIPSVPGLPSTLWDEATAPRESLSSATPEIQVSSDALAKADGLDRNHQESVHSCMVCSAKFLDESKLR